MDEIKRSLIGSPLNDLFKHKHKTLRRDLYMLDIDCVFISSSFPYSIIAFADIKKPGEDITFSEAVCYNQLAASRPVYIIYAIDADIGIFDLNRFITGDSRTKPPTVKLRHLKQVETWQDYEAWESKLRELFKQGKLK